MHGLGPLDDFLGSGEPTHPPARQAAELGCRSHGQALDARASLGVQVLHHRLNFLVTPRRPALPLVGLVREDDAPNLARGRDLVDGPDLLPGQHTARGVVGCVEDDHLGPLGVKGLQKPCPVDREAVLHVQSHELHLPSRQPHPGRVPREERLEEDDLVPGRHESLHGDADGLRAARCHHDVLRGIHLPYLGPQASIKVGNAVHQRRQAHERGVLVKPLALQPHDGLRSLKPRGPGTLEIGESLREVHIDGPLRLLQQGLPLGDVAARSLAGHELRALAEDRVAAVRGGHRREAPKRARAPAESHSPSRKVHVVRGWITLSM
mmetsp:Transcript_7620/g.26214  ORF Transcript_7620/g.26214 Transcript_7620/m.26214 type:complete len:322 (+) Transcript_7620:1698-2663(+)